MEDSSSLKSLPPLFVDLDDTFLKTDLLLEQIAIFFKTNPFAIFLLFIWCLRGRCYLKNKLAEHVNLDIAHLPYRSDVVQLVKQRHAAGHAVVLASASHTKFVNQIAEHFKIFSAALGSNTEINLKGKNKLEAIQKYLLASFNQKNKQIEFSYAGDATADLKIWFSNSHKNSDFNVICTEAIAVNPSRALKKKLHVFSGKKIIISDEQHPVQTFIKAILKQLRIHQWAKNGLVFVPTILGHQFLDSISWFKSILAFLAFSFMASSVYLMNDLWDLESDRRHTRKKNRPFAAGKLSLLWGVILFPNLIILANVIGILLGPAFLYIIWAYFITNIVYSSYLKRIAILDVVCLGVLYTMRILAGGEATGIEISQWLLAFSTFFFFGLAMVKRYTEVSQLKNTSVTTAHGRGYRADDSSAIYALGAASSLISVLILVLYINSENVVKLYHHSHRLWLITPVLLYWVVRFWLLAHRNQMHDDPLVFVIKDKITIGVGCIIGLLFFLSL